jgi:hypothetical protein
MMKAHGINANGASIRNTSTPVPAKREHTGTNKKRKLDQFSNDHAGGAVDDDEGVAKVKTEAECITIKSEVPAEDDAHSFNGSEPSGCVAIGQPVGDRRELGHDVLGGHSSSTLTGQSDSAVALNSKSDPGRHEQDPAATYIGTPPSAYADADLTFLGMRLGCNVGPSEIGTRTSILIPE